MNEYQLLPILTPDEYARLKASIAERGVQVPIVVDEHGAILDGHNRARIAAELGIDCPMQVRQGLPDYDKRLLAVALNVDRRQLTDLQRAIIGKQIEPDIAEQARQRQGKRNDLATSAATAAEVPKVLRTSDQVAEKIGLGSGDTFERLETLLDDVAEELPELMPLVESGQVESREARQKLSARRQEAKNDVLRAQSDIPLPTGRYRCIIIDPPWPIRKIERDVRPDQGEALDYPPMSLEEIEQWPVPDYADEEGCHLYLWVTQRFLPHGLKLVDAWGFNYQCLLTWVKPVGFTPFSWMYNTEHVIFARSGSLDLLQVGLKLSFDAPTSGHSVKPDTFYERVASASPGPRLELFARSPRDGFFVWGNEAGGHDA